MADPVTIQAEGFLEEIDRLNKTVSLLRMELRARAIREDELVAKIKQLETQLGGLVVQAQKGKRKGK